MTVGVTEGSIMPAIITAHMMNIISAYAGVHCGIAINGIMAPSAMVMSAVISDDRENRYHQAMADIPSRDTRVVMKLRRSNLPMATVWFGGPVPVLVAGQALITPCWFMCR